MNRKNLLPGTEIFGHSFEHLIFQEIIAYLGYSQSSENITYWRTSSGYEVDFIVGNGRVAIEIKATDEVKSRHLKGLKAFKEDYSQARTIIVSLDKYSRIMSSVEIIPAEQFLKGLWNSEII